MLEKPEPETCPYCGDSAIEQVHETHDTARWRCPDCGLFSIELSPGRRGP